MRSPLPTLRHGGTARCPHYIMVVLRTVPVQPKAAISRFYRLVFH